MLSYHEAGRRREAHAGVDALAVAHGGEARPVAEMSEDDAVALRRRITKTGEFLHQKSVG
ncbi:MAG: hypothetical protein J6386_11860 [Candidatus Synoicihabitans palmerolidicus]|nr:hypothetical protein [Candidatus Synoicihabitans palmerolidicus]